MKVTRLKSVALAFALAFVFSVAIAADGDEIGALERAFQKAADKVAQAVVSIECDRVEASPRRRPPRRIPPRRTPEPKPKPDPKKDYKHSPIPEEDKPTPESAEKPKPKPKPPGRRIPYPRRGRSDFRKRPDAPFSGVLIEDGYVLTTAFNMGGNVSNIKVTLADGRRFDAVLLGKDETRDLALLKIDTKEDLPGLSLPMRADLETGDFVIVVGRSESVVNHSLTTGIVSSLKRANGLLYQIDAKLNYGNTGGAVVDIEGRLLGIASGVSTRNSYGICSGVGFLTPVHGVRKVLPDLKAGKIIKRPKRPYLGVQGDEADKTPGARIARVLPNSAASRAKLKDGDLIIEFNRVEIKDWTHLRKEILKCKVGDRFTCKVKREDKDGNIKEHTLRGRIGIRPIGR